MTADQPKNVAVSEAVDRLCNGTSLEQAACRELFSDIVGGKLTDLQLAGLLVALKGKGETAAEIAGAAQALRDAALPFADTADRDTADSCGTGGDGSGTMNISTAVALVAAEAGLPMVKHGNRSVSSRCGSADVLRACGVKIDATPHGSARCLRELNICFLFAPQYHAGIKYAMPARTGLGVRTIFNLLGPLVNPARPRFQLVGVYAPELCQPVAETLQLLGCEAALVVHGAGLDEIALHAPTSAVQLEKGRMTPMTIDPVALGLAYRSVDLLRGADGESNAAWLKRVLAGQGSDPENEMVALNVGALLWIAGRAAELGDGLQIGFELLKRGKACDRLERWAELSNDG